MPQHTGLPIYLDAMAFYYMSCLTSIDVFKTRLDEAIKHVEAPVEDDYSYDGGDRRYVYSVHWHMMNIAPQLKERINSRIKDDVRPLLEDPIVIADLGEMDEKLDSDIDRWLMAARGLLFFIAQR